MSGPPLDVARVQADFPILKRQVHGRRLVYLDSASSSQKPTAVLDAMDHLYRESYANVHRGVYAIAEEATAAYEGARARVASFLGAPSPSEVVFTRNVTEAINLVARSWGAANLHEGDVVVLTDLEHHANIVPWHILAAERGIELRWVPLTDDYRLDTSDLDSLLDGAKLFAFSAASNVLGTINDVSSLVAAAHAAGALALVDAAQHAPHRRLDVTEWGADFVGVTGHKMLGPTGDRRAVGPRGAARRDAAVPRRGRDDPRRPPGRVHRPTRCPGSSRPAPCRSRKRSGSRRRSTTSRRSAWTRSPRTTAPSPATRWPRSRTGYGDRLAIYGPRTLDARAAIISFLFDGIHAHDISQVVDEHGVCVRAGHHCAKPLMRKPRRAPPPPGPRSTSTTTSPTSTRSSRPSPPPNVPSAI